jgi:ABC-2 type transport system permease protein
LVSTLFVFVVSLVLGLVYSDYNEVAIIFSDLDYLFAFFIKLVGFFSFGLFLGILVKRSAFAVGAMFVWLIIENMFKGYLYWSFNGAENTGDKVDSVMQFLPLESMTNLIKEPFSRLGAVRSAANTMGETFTKSYDVEFTTILIVAFWRFVFIYWAYALCKWRGWV